MRKSARAIRARKRRNRRLSIIGLGLAAALAVFAAWSLANPEDKGPSGCVVADVSESTKEARKSYLKEFSEFATDIGLHGSGKVCLVLAAEDPTAQSRVAVAEVGPDDGDENSPLTESEVETKVQEATAQLEALLVTPTVDASGSRLVEGAAIAASHLESGDRLLMLSDGLQNGPDTGRVIKLEEGQIPQVMDHLGEVELIPDLSGIEVEFPLMLFHPEGIGVSAERAQVVREFWRQWVELSAGTLKDLSY